MPAILESADANGRINPTTTNAVMTTSTSTPDRVSGHELTPPLDLFLATVNLGRGLSAEEWSRNLITLKDVDVICASEPGDLDRLPGRAEVVLQEFDVIFQRRNVQSGNQHSGGAALLVRRSRFQTSRTRVHITWNSRTDVQFAAVHLQRGQDDPAVVVVCVYATNVQGGPSCPQFEAAMTSVLGDVRRQYPLTPIVFAGDFNARNTIFGDSSTHPRGRTLMTWCLEKGYRVEAVPSRGDSCLDLVLVPATTPSTSAKGRTVCGTDHTTAVLVEIDPDPRWNCKYYTNRLDLRGLNEDTFLRELDRRLQGRGGTPHGRERRISSALSAALLYAGAEWTRARTSSERRTPDLTQILNAARSNPWKAVAMARAAPSRMATAHDCAALLAAFGSQGKQRTHPGAHPVPEMPPRVTPVTPEEVKSSIVSNNPKACADSSGVDARILSIAARSDRFLQRFAELLTHCMQKARMPGAWTSCTVSPIPKPGRDPSVIANLRPIYLTTMLAKTADRVFDRRVRHAWTPHPHQFGFRKGVPISAVPLALIGQASEAIRTNAAPAGFRRRGHRALLIAVDLSDAFPGTPTRCIVEGYGDAVPPDLMAAKTAMLSRRQLRVRYCNKYSAWDAVQDGTNQGFVSGPTDFSAASSTLLQRLDAWKAAQREVQREFAMVADDLSACVSGQSDLLVHAANDFLRIVERWAREYGFAISPKSEALYITAPHAHASEFQHTLSCGGVNIPVKAKGSIRLLGYHIDARLNFSEAVSQACAQHVNAWLALMPLMSLLSPMDRKIIYEAIALCHIRRIAPLILCHSSKEESAEHWKTLDTSLGGAARMMFRTHATAHTHACINEAGLLDSRGLAISETVHLRHKLRAANLPGSVPAKAIKFLERYKVVGFSQPRPATGVVVDRQPLAPADSWVERHVEFKTEPTLSASERLKLQRKRTPESEKNAIKQEANERLRLLIPERAKVIFCDGSVLRRTANRPRAGGGGAAVYFKDGDVVTATRRPAGAAACSFTAELIGMLGAVDLTPHIDVMPGETIYIISDSQSLVSALAKGIARQNDLRVAKLWESIANMVKRLECRFSFQFAFGHAKWVEADTVDRFAKAAAEDGADFQGLEWWVDLARQECTTALDTHLPTVMKGSLRGDLKSERPGLRPTRWPKSEWSRSAQHCAAAVTLAQLRTNACAQVGGHLARETELCPRCRTMTMRNSDVHPSMVQHMFHCRSTAGHRRHHRIDGIQDLWTHPLRALALVRLYWRAT